MKTKLVIFGGCTFLIIALLIGLPFIKFKIEKKQKIDTLVAQIPIAKSLFIENQALFNDVYEIVYSKKNVASYGITREWKAPDNIQIGFSDIFDADFQEKVDALNLQKSTEYKLMDVPLFSEVEVKKIEEIFGLEKEEVGINSINPFGVITVKVGGLLDLYFYNSADLGVESKQSEGGIIKMEDIGGGWYIILQEYPGI